MIPKIHKRGTSFRGIAQYILHDKDADTKHRVAWTQTRNMATQKADLAWRIMAATAIDAPRLKAQAGIKSTGRKSKDVVQHLTLSWRADEAKDLTRQEMLRAATGAIKALKAEKHQTLIACHTDEEHSHIHIVICRVSPEDGRLLTNAKEKLALSRWAQSYEQERGEVLCKQRALNNAARDRGEFVRSKKDRPRHLYELEASNDDPKHRADQRARDAAIGKGDRTSATGSITLASLRKGYLSRGSAIRKECKSKIATAVQGVRDRYRPEWEALYQKQQEAFRRFEENEKSLVGRAVNLFKSIDFMALIRAGERRRALSDAFRAAAGAAARREQFNEQLDRESRKLASRQRTAERKAAEPLREDRKARLDANRERHLIERAELRLTTKMQKAKVRAQWKTRKKERAEIYKTAKVREPSNENAPPVKETFNHAAEPPTTNGAGDTDGKAPEIAKADEIARRIEKLKQSRKSREDRGPRPPKR